jgi:hypothetical protein
MEKLIEHLYTKFLFRDILSYAVPGAIALWAVAHLLRQRIELRGTTTVVAFCFVAYLAGLFLQAVGTFGYEHSRWCLFRFHPVPLSIDQTRLGKVDLEYNRMVWASIPEDSRVDFAMMRAERFAALKQIHANASLALFLVFVAVASRPSPKFWMWLITVLLILSVSAVLFHEHKKLVIKEQVWRQIMVENFKE